MEVCKDVYETDNLPEADQDYEEDVKDCVETLNISVLSAYNRFRGKEVPLNETIRKCNLKRNENPLDRSKRILQELDALNASLKKITEAVNVDANESVSNEQLSGLIDALSTQVREMDMEKYFGPSSGFEIEDPKNVVFKNVVDKMNQFKVQSPKISKEETKHSYSLIRQPSVVEYINKMKTANLQKRLEILEKAVGNDNVKLSGLVADCPSKGLLEAVERLTAKTALLNPGQLAIVESRLAAVVGKLQSAPAETPAGGSLLDPESQMKIAELYELIKKHDATMDTVTNIVDQCVTMQDFHVKGAKLSQCLSHLEVKQHELTSKVRLSEMVLKNIDTKMAANFETMEGNLRQVEARLGKIQ